MTVLRVVHARPSETKVSQPKVLTRELQQKLELLNRAVRWLRSNGYAPISADTLAPRPCIVVPATAAEFLCKAGHGMDTRRQPGGERIHSVVVGQCEIRWNSEEQG